MKKLVDTPSGTVKFSNALKLFLFVGLTAIQCHGGEKSMSGPFQVCLPEPHEGEGEHYSEQSRQCIEPLVPKLLDELEHGRHDDPYTKMRFAGALVDLYESKNDLATMDKLNLKGRLAAYRQANDMSGRDDETDLWIQFFGRLGPEYEADVAYAKRLRSDIGGGAGGSPTFMDRINTALQAVASASQGSSAAQQANEDTSPNLRADPTLEQRESARCQSGYQECIKQRQPTPSYCQNVLNTCNNGAQGPALAQDRHYTPGVPQCSHSEYDSRRSSDYWLINTCDTKVYVHVTSDGPLWGAISLAPGERRLFETGDAASPKKSGEITLYTCPGESVPVTPEGKYLDHSYHGSYVCKTD
jgi:hypothetical protein